MNSRSVRTTHNQQLKNPKIAAEYINQALASEDVSIMLLAIRNIVDAQEGGISALAEKTNLGRESMYKMLSPNGNPKLSTLTALLNGLGLSLQVVPTKKSNYRKPR